MWDLFCGILAGTLGFLFFKFPGVVAEANAAWQYDNFHWKFSKKLLDLNIKMVFFGGILFMIIGVLTVLFALLDMLK